MRTDQDILERIEYLNGELDPFGFEKNDLMSYLSFEAATPFLKEGTTQEQWDHVRPEGTDSAIMAQISSYLPFAWDKANDCRGLSAARSLYHLRAYLWLVGNEELAEHLFPYSHYGKRGLVLVSEFARFDWKTEDNGKWVNQEGGEISSAEEILGRNKKTS